MLVVRKIVKHILLDNFSFSEIFSDWLSNHLEHLTLGSRTILMDLKDKDFDLVRYSTLVSLNTNQEHRQFELNVRVLVQNGDAKRKSIFDTGIAETHALGRTLSFEDFKAIVKIVLRKDIADKAHVDFYRGVALHEWLKVNEEKENQEQF